MQSGICNDLTSQQILLAIQDPDLAQQVKGMLTRHRVKELKASPTLLLSLNAFIIPTPAF